jgi:pyridoxamine 5'-phosphate oxidase family protein
MVSTRKFRNVRTNPHVGFVVDDVLPPWRPRCVTVRGDAEAVDEHRPDGSRRAVIRITPHHVTSWGVPDGD